ncbi:MAG TPA: hypothetical protein VGF65_06535 [Mycobacterium sp.]
MPVSRVEPLLAQDVVSVQGRKRRNGGPARWRPVVIGLSAGAVVGLLAGLLPVLGAFWVLSKWL